MDADRVFTEISSLFDEVELDGRGGFRIPVEMRPDTASVPAKEGEELIFASLQMVCEQLFRLVEMMLEIPDHEERLKNFFKEWEERNSGKDLRVFYYLKFRLEGRLQWIKFQD